MTIEKLRHTFKAFAAVHDLALSSRGHGLQKRNDGKTPYMVHVDAVILGVYDYLKGTLRGLGEGEFLAHFMELYLCVAGGHDLLEDTDITEDEIKAAINDKLSGVYNHPIHEIDIINAIRNITKRPKGEEEYADYLKRVASSALSRVVKIADLRHNISDLKPGNMRDKYSVSLLVLTDYNCLPPNYE